MPELAEVEFYRKRWHDVAAGRRIRAVHLHARARVFRGTDPRAIAADLPKAPFTDSWTAAKQIAIYCAGAGWLGIHLGMSGELTVEPAAYSPAKHDHLVLDVGEQRLVFRDPRMFGRIRYDRGSQPPDWWTSIAPPLLSREFSVPALADFLQQRRRAPIKAVLLMQERFPGIGNWMADEILWRAELHPRRAAGSLKPEETRRLHGTIRRVCRMALRAIAGSGPTPPPDLNVNIPSDWLFRHRWSPGGRCPKTGVLLARAEIGGRTTCWSPARQKLPAKRTPRS